jgi:NADP-dependent alcohol dehydrogenase
MILRRESATEVHSGSRALETVCRALDEQTLIFVDTNIVFDRKAIRVDAGDNDCDAVRVLARQIAAHSPRTVLGIGGGSVLDLVKLACLIHADPVMADLLEVWGSRAGAITLPATRSRPVRRIFAPTTVGTGVEVSSVACVRVGDHRRIVAGSALRPDLAVLDPELTATLPAHLLREGVLEALLRIIGPVAGSDRVGGLPDAESAVLARRLVTIGDRIAAGETGPEVRLDAAMLSAATHTGWALIGRGRYSAKHWYLANELSTTLGLRKMVATASLLPAIWSRILRGDTRYGNASALREAWNWIDDTDPVTGLRALLRRWRIDHDIDAPVTAISDAAVSAIRSWGGRLPMLSGLTVTEINELYTEAVGVACLA